MAKCKNCQCDCHCNSAMHLPKDELDLDKGGACVCDNCECNNKRTYKKHKDWATDMSYENNGGLVIDDTGECESCQ